MSTTGAPGTSGRYLPRRAWHIVCSTKTTVILLATIAAIALLGTLFPQLSAETFADARAYAEFVAAAQDRYGGLVQALSILGVFNVYRSTPFLVLLAALVLNGISCTVDRIAPVWRSVTARPNPVRGDSFYRRSSCRTSVQVPSREAGRRLTTSVLSRHRYQLSSEESEDASYIVGSKYQWARVGSLVTHSALILLATGALWSTFSAWSEPAVALGPGQSYDVAHGHSFEVRHDLFDIARYPQGQVRDYLSHLVVLRQGTELVRKTVRVSDPLVYEGVAFHLSSWGPSVRVLGWDSSGQPLPMQAIGAQGISVGEIVVNFAPPEDARSLYLPSMEAALHLSLVESLAQGEPSDAPFLLVEAWPSGETEPSVSTRVRAGETLVLAGASLEFFEDYHSVLRVVSDPGFQPVIIASLIGEAGLLISFYFYPSRVWIKLTDSELLLVESAERDSVASDGQFARLVAELQTEHP